MFRSAKAVFWGVVLTLAAVTAVSASTLELQLVQISPGSVKSPIVVDNNQFDSNTQIGAVTYIGSVGNFNVNVTTGIGSPILPNGALNLISFNFSNERSPGTLQLWFTETGLTAPLGTTGFNLALQGMLTALGSATYSVYYDATNTAFGTGTLIGSLGPYSTSSYSGAGTGSLALGPGPYSLTQVVTITLLRPTPAPGTVGSFVTASLTPVPEPGTLALLGAGLLGMGGILRKKFLR